LSPPIVDKEEPTLESVQNTVWKLTAIEKNNSGGKIDTLVVPSDQSFTVVFTASGVSGRADCNIYSGSYSTADNQAVTISLPTLSSSCGSNSIDTQYLTALEAARAYSVSASALKIVYDEGTLHFILHTEQSTLTIEDVYGVEWKLEALEEADGEKIFPSVADPITLTLGRNGVCGGAVECNKYGGEYESTVGKNVTFSNLLAVVNCVNTTIGQRYLRDIVTMTSYEISETVLRLKGDNGITFHFVRNSEQKQSLNLQYALGKRWELVAFADNLGNQTPPQSFITLQFGTSLVGGQINCNDYSAEYAQTGINLIKFTGFQITPTCANQPDQGKFDAIMQDINSFFLTENEFVLYASDGQALVFQRNTTFAESDLHSINVLMNSVIPVSDELRIKNVHLDEDDNILQVTVQVNACTFAEFHLYSHIQTASTLNIPLYLVCDFKDDPCGTQWEERTINFDLSGLADTARQFGNPQNSVLLQIFNHFDGDHYTVRLAL
jgi:heat shock protein HslJ